jgi:hypothetical protein
VDTIKKYHSKVELPKNGKAEKHQYTLTEEVDKKKKKKNDLTTEQWIDPKINSK